MEDAERGRETIAAVKGAVICAGAAIPIGARQLRRRLGALDDDDENGHGDDGDATTGSGERAA